MQNTNNMANANAANNGQSAGLYSNARGVNDSSIVVRSPASTMDFIMTGIGIMMVGFTIEKAIQGIKWLYERNLR